ncbi:MAG: protein tyrosine phosphatase family protein [Cocleimonas sp.]|nr:protein tyrosine phosphatase family protein [Cocleimonas sp.]
MQNISRDIGSSLETQVLNYIPINTNLATSGQPTPLQIEAIAAAGYDCIINLAMHDSTDALFEEGGLVSEVGMNYFHIPVPFDAPTVKHLTLFLNLMRALKGKKVWLHCAYNWRASAFTGHYQRKVLGVLSDEIEMIVLEQWEPDEAWLAFFDVEI